MCREPGGDGEVCREADDDGEARLWRPTVTAWDVGRRTTPTARGAGAGDATAKGAGRPGKIAMDRPEAGEMRRGRSEVRAACSGNYEV